MINRETAGGCTTETRALELLSFMWGEAPAVFELRGTERASDHGVYNLGTPEGRAAWKAAAPEGVERIVIEDGERWVSEVLDEFRDMVQAYAERFAV